MNNAENEYGCYPNAKDGSGLGSVAASLGIIVVNPSVYNKQQKHVMHIQ